MQPSDASAGSNGRTPAESTPEAATLEAPTLEALLAQFQAPLLRYAARLIRDEDEAQDVVQEVFVKYHNSPPAGREGKQLSVWLYRVAHNLCIDRIRKESRMRAQAVQMPLPDHAPPASAALMAEDTRRELDRLLGRLNDNQRTVVILKIQEGKSYKEISEITGLTVSNVGFLIHTAMKKLNGFVREASPSEVI